MDFSNSKVYRKAYLGVHLVQFGSRVGDDDSLIARRPLGSTIFKSRDLAKGWVGIDAGRAISRPKSPNKEISRANSRVRVSDERASQLGDFGFDRGAEQKEDSATRCSDDNSGRVCLVRTTRSRSESMVAAVTFGAAQSFTPP